MQKVERAPFRQMCLKGAVLPNQPKSWQQPESSPYSSKMDTISSTLSKSDRPGRDSRRWMAAKILTASCSAGRRTVSPDKLSFFQQADHRIAHFPIKQFFRKSLQTFTSINKKNVRVLLSILSQSMSILAYSKVVCNIF